jgi:peroxiredoxin Q/BCP
MLQKGTKAPYFEGKDENGNIVKLTDFAGKKLVLYFYPKDSTPGCTAEAWGEKKMYGKVTEGTLRTTYVIDENGIIVDAIGKVDTKNHSAQLLH